MRFIDELIEQCEAVIDGPNAEAAIDALLQQSLADLPTFRSQLPPLTQEEALLHCSEKLTMVLVRLTPNVHFPAHNHNMKVRVAVYEGGERHVFYEKQGEGLLAKGLKDFLPGEVAKGDVDMIHSVANFTDQFAGALHIYFGDLVHTPRRIWTNDHQSSVPYSDEKYFEFAAPLDPSKPFNRPALCFAHKAD